MRKILVASLLCVAGLVVPSSLRADSTTLTWSSYTGPSTFFTPNAQNVGFDVFSIPLGQAIISATFTSSFGGKYGTAPVEVFVDGVEVGNCASSSSTCSKSGPDTFSFNFTPSQFATLSLGVVDLYVIQTGSGKVNLGPSTLTIHTSPLKANPEPATFFMVGSAVAIGILRRKKRLA